MNSYNQDDYAQMNFQPPQQIFCDLYWDYIQTW